MKYYLDQNVFDAALDRIRWLFSEFEHISVNISGGKDSTVVLNLSLKVAEELGRLPLEVMFIDQEAEWQMVIDHIRQVFADPRVAPRWYQMPIRIFNATSTREPWLYCWEPGKKWVREKEPGAITENVYGTDRFTNLFGAILRYDHPHEPACDIGGVRTEESPVRRLGLTTYETYKGATWGKVNTKGLAHYSFYPIYDWSYKDVWKAIHDNDWPYCPLYDLMYQYGVPIQNMRVSNIHHETAVNDLFYLQEVEGETWDRIVARISGISSAGQLQEQFFGSGELPFMFKDWREYRDHLCDNLITDLERRAYFHRRFAQTEALFDKSVHPALIKTHIAMILVNDYHGTKMESFRAGHAKDHVNRGKISGRRT